MDRVENVVVQLRAPVPSQAMQEGSLMYVLCSLIPRLLYNPYQGWSAAGLGSIPELELELDSIPIPFGGIGIGIELKLRGIGIGIEFTKMKSKGIGIELILSAKGIERN